MKKHKKKDCTHPKHNPTDNNKPGRYKHKCPACGAVWKYVIEKPSKRR